MLVELGKLDRYALLFGAALPSLALDARYGTEPIIQEIPNIIGLLFPKPMNLHLRLQQSDTKPSSTTGNSIMYTFVCIVMCGVDNIKNIISGNRYRYTFIMVDD